MHLFFGVKESVSLGATKWTQMVKHRKGVSEETAQVSHQR